MSARFAWEPLVCGLTGHVTYRPSEPDLADRLGTPTPRGEAWLCLRCGSYVPGAPIGQGPANHAPIVLRGRALSDAVILRVLSVDKGLRGLVLLAVAAGIWRFDGSRNSIRHTVDAYLPVLRTLDQQAGIHLEDASAMHWIQEALEASSTMVLAVAAFVALYAILQLVESVGLWLLKRWGEYVAVIGTSLFLPLEIYEIAEKVTVLRVFALVVNLFLVVYLVTTKRLFGVRGGRRAHERERENTSLLEVEQAALGES